MEMRVNTPIPESTPGNPAALLRHLAGRTPREWLLLQLKSSSKNDRRMAIADPKLPTQDRDRVLKEFLGYGSDPDEMREMFLMNPMMPTADLERMAEAWKVGLADIQMNPLVHLLYEHPHLSEARQTALMTPLKDEPQPADAIRLRCAVIHGEMTSVQMVVLAGQWEALLADQEADERENATLKRGAIRPLQLKTRTLSELGQAAGRIVSHPQTPDDVATRMMERACATPLSGLVWESMVSSWQRLRHRPRGRDWAMVQRLPRSRDVAPHGSYDNDIPAMAIIATLESEAPHANDTDLLLWAMEESHRAMGIIRSAPHLEQRIEWTRERVRQCVGSLNKAMREYGISRMAELARGEEPFCAGGSALPSIPVEHQAKGRNGIV